MNSSFFQAGILTETKKDIKMFAPKIKKLAWILFALLLVFIAYQIPKQTKDTATPPTLNVLTYSSFVSLYGPGRILKKDFEKECSCEVHWIVGEDSTGLIQRLALHLNVDVIIGLDQLSLLKTTPSNWQKIPLQEEDFIPEVKSFLNSPFIPINWAPIGWIYKIDRTSSPPSSLPSIVQKFKQISFPAPHSSTLGLQFYYWIYNYFEGDKEKIKNFLKKLKPKTYGGSIASWSLSYGFFKKGHVDLSLSYLTSPLYHIKEEASNQYHFAYFKEGHPWQVEFAGILKSSNKKDLAETFVQFLLNQKAQSLIMNTNYMFPVIKNVRKGIFKTPEIPSLLSYKDIKNFYSEKEELLKLWKESL